MGTLLQALIPAAVGLLVYQGGLTRAGRLRSMIKANVELLGSLPEDHPSRATLAPHIEELVSTLIRRQRRGFEPFTRAGVSFGINATLAVLTAMAVGDGLLEVSGFVQREPTTPKDQWYGVIGTAIVAVVCGVLAYRAWRRQQQEQLQPGQA